MATLRITYEGTESLIIQSQDGNVITLGSGVEINLNLTEGLILDVREGAVMNMDHLAAGPQPSKRPQLTLIKGDKT